MGLDGIFVCRQAGVYLLYLLVYPSAALSLFLPCWRVGVRGWMKYDYEVTHPVFWVGLDRH
jgi:hypothetical protein